MKDSAKLTPEDFPDVQFKCDFLRGFESGSSRKLLDWGQQIADAASEKAYEQGKKDERERLTNSLQELIEMSEKVKEPAIKVKMMAVLQSLKEKHERR